MKGGRHENLEEPDNRTGVLVGAMLLIMTGDSVVADPALKPSYEQGAAPDYVAIAPVRHTVTETTLLTFTVAGTSDTWAWLFLEFWTPA